MKKVILSVFLSFIFSFTSQATHLMGGEITWKCVKSGPDAGKYIFQVKIYRDCNGVDLQNVNNKSLVVHNNVNLSSIALNYLGSTDISPICDSIDSPNSPFSCNGSNIGFAGNGEGAVEEHIFESDPVRILGQPDADGWHFTYTDIARNLAIINLDNNIGEYGFTLRAVMYSYTDSLNNILPISNNCYDSSPKFYEKPRTILEVDNGFDPLAFSNGFTYSHNAFDDERDSLSYDFGQPLDGYNDPSGGYFAPPYDYLNPDITNAIPFAPGYSVNLPINGIVMNNQTGRTFYPASQQGNFVTCTKVTAYRCGQKVSEVYREVQVVLVPQTCNLGDTTGGNIGADTLCNVRPLVQPPFFFPLGNPQFQWDTIVHCGDTVSFDFIANDYDVYPNGTLQNLHFSVSGGQFLDYNVNPPALCDNPPCATFEEIGSGANPPFTTSGGTGSGHFEWITSCNHTISTCGDDLLPSLYTFVIKVQDDFCPAPAIENTAQVISIMVLPPCDSLKANPTVIPAICTSNNGSISVNPSGGLPPYISFYFDMSGLPVNPNALIAGEYEVRVRDSSLCERIDTITVTQVINSFASTDTQVHCDSYTWVDSVTYTSSNNTATFMLTTADGCDSLSTLNLTINNSFSITDTQVHCDSYTWVDGNTYTSSNNTATILYTNSLGCDSIVNLDLTIYNSSSSTDTQVHCDSYTWVDGNTYTSSNNSATFMFQTVDGCDSLSTLDLTIYNSSSSTDTQVHCDTYTWVDGNTYTSSNNSATFMFTTLDGCDSLSTLNLTINTSTLIIDTQVHCDTFVWIDGNTYTASNNTATYYAGSNSVGCDSSYTLDLTINNSSSSTDTQVHCDSYTWIDGVTYTSSNNSATFMLTTGDGCDSLSTLDLTINYSDSSLATVTSCDSYLWNGVIYTSSGSYDTLLISSDGCDSIATLNLTIFGGNNFSSNISSIPASCYGDLDGSIDLTPLGVPPYNFLWSNGATTEDISGLSAGVYSVIITDSTTCTIFDTVTISEPSQINSSLTVGVGTLTGIASGGTMPYTLTIYDPLNSFFSSSVGNFGTSYTVNPLVSGQYCMITLDANGCTDTACALFVTDFSPDVDISISNNWCDSLTDLLITVTQDSGEVDMSTALLQSNAGSFDIASMNVGDTIGTATMMAGGGSINLNTFLVVSTILSPTSVVISSLDTVLGNLGAFTISNQPGGGINILSNTVPDGNNYTSGNMSSVFFDNVFINPCIPLVFTTTINSELGDVQITTFNFSITALYDIITDDIKIYPNPTQDRVVVDFNRKISSFSLSLYDMLGKNTYYKDRFYDLSSKEISFGSLSGGTYLLIMDVDGVMYQHQIIIQD
tara:strand:+ start:3724 stop:7746 length:4023 start_codon:yes stop_codon:yes gene_type:complete